MGVTRPSVHPNIRTGHPCSCGFYQPHSSRRLSRTASKLDWLKDRPDFQTPENKDLWKLLQYHTVNIGTKLDPLLPWIAREVKKGRIHKYPGGEVGHFYTKQPIEGAQGWQKNVIHGGDLAHLADWNQSNHASRQGVDLMQHTWPEIQGKVGEWDRYLEEQQEKADQDALTRGEVVHQWPDNWSIRKLGPEHLEAEGDAMGHCVGGYGYADQVRNGETQIYSLRDPNHQPHATMELTTDDHNGWGHPQYPGKTMSGQDAEDLFHETGEDAIPMLHNGQLVQIQGKSDEMPIPEYQARFKDWLATIPEKERPYWESESMVDEPEGLPEHPEFRQPDEGGYGGGYGPHGDYGVQTKADADYDAILDEMGRRAENSNQGGYSASVDGDGMDALYQHALNKKEIPKFANAVSDFGDQQQNFFDDWRMMNSEYGMSMPSGEEQYPLTPEDPNYPIPEGNYDHGDTIENEEQHEKMYYDEEGRWADEHPGMKMTNYLYRLLNPHYGPGAPRLNTPGDPDSSIISNGYQNQLFEDPTAKYRSQLPGDAYWLDKQWEHPGQDQWNQQQGQQVTSAHTRNRKPHPHFRTGDPCYCPWGSHHNQEILGAVHEASKIDWLVERKDKYSQTPEGQEALKNLQRIVGEEPKIDPLAPWLWREIKKKRLTPGLRYTSDPGYGPDIGHIADWYASNSPSRRGVDVMQLQFAPSGDENSIQTKINQWDEELRAKMEEERQMSQGEVMHRFPDDWTIRRLRGDELGDEGDAMGHCVGGMGYDREVEAGHAGIFSLRDPHNDPHVTMELRPPGTEDNPSDEGTRDQLSHDENGMLRAPGAAVWQIQGKSDSEPIPEYKDRLKDWFKTLDPPAYVPSNQSKTSVPVATDPDSLAFWHEPEEDESYGDDPYRLSPGSGYDYGLDSDADKDPFEWQGGPDWPKVVNNTLHRQYAGRGYTYEPDRGEDVNGIAHEHGLEDELRDSVESHYPEMESNFYQNVYNEDAVIGPQEQWNNWDRGQMMNGLYHGNRNQSMLRRGPDEQPLTQDQITTPQIHPGQGGLPLPGQMGLPGQQPSGLLRAPTPPYQDPSVSGHPWYAPLSKVAAKVPPIYYRFVFSPKGGVSLVDNDTTHPAWTPYHRDIAGASGEANLIHGFAYRIGDGWRLTTEEHKPVHDPHVVAQVVRALMEREGHQKPRQSAWTPTEWDFDRTHFGLPFRG